MNTELSSRQKVTAGRIPTGFWPKAQGCESRATLGGCPLNPINRNAVVAEMTRDFEAGIGHNPLGVGKYFNILTQGSSFLATMGWRTQSLWDCQSTRPHIGFPTGGAS
jgi:hypothetical protein